MPQFLLQIWKNYYRNFWDTKTCFQRQQWAKLKHWTSFQSLKVECFSQGCWSLMTKLPVKCREMWHKLRMLPIKTDVPQFVSWLIDGSLMWNMQKHFKKEPEHGKDCLKMCLTCWVPSRSRFVYVCQELRENFQKDPPFLLKDITGNKILISQYNQETK